MPNEQQLLLRLLVYPIRVPMTTPAIPRPPLSNYRRSEEAKARRAEMLVAINKCRQIAGQGKAHHAVQFAQDMAEAGEPLVLFGVHKDVLEFVHAELRNTGLKTDAITGDQAGDERQAAVDRFQEGETDVLLGTISAMGEGLTLTRASHVAFIEQAWRPADHDQAEDRLHRIGQENSVNVYYLIDDRTIDQHMSELIAGKRATIEQATGDSKPQQQAVDAMELARRLGGLDGHRTENTPSEPVQEDIEETVAIPGGPK